MILIGMALRLVMLGVDVRFHPDEALFAAQARLISARGDVLLRETDLDKPPLTLFVTALSYRILGPTEFATRLPNVLFSGLSVAVIYTLAMALYGDRVTATLAGLLMALSPYDLAFAATAFTDVQATFWVLVAAWCAVRDRWTAAGIAAALAFAAKSNALIMLPLIVALGIAHNARTEWRVRDGLERVGRLVGPLALGAALLVGWDMARAPRSFFELGYSRNNPGRLIRADELWPRAERWLHWLGFISGTRVLNVMWLAMLPVHLARHSRTRSAVADWLIAAFGVAFMALHWLIAFNTYDRYLHPLVPFVILLAARLVSGLNLPHPPTPSPSAGEGEINSERIPFSARVRGLRGEGRLARIVLGILVIGMMIPAAAKTLRGEARIGGDQGQHSGIDTLADVLNTRLSGEIVYDHWLGWELAYYLGDTPHVIILYSPMPEALADELHDNQQSSLADESTPRYFVAPSSALAAPWVDALRRVGTLYSIAYQDTANGFVIYRLGR